MDLDSADFSQDKDNRQIQEEQPKPKEINGIINQYEIIRNALKSVDGMGKKPSREFLIDAVKSYIETGNNVFLGEDEAIRLAAYVPPTDMLKVLAEQYIQNIDVDSTTPLDLSKSEDILRNAVISTKEKYNDEHPNQALTALRNYIEYDYSNNFTNDNNARDILTQNLTRDDVLTLIAEDFVDREMGISKELEHSDKKQEIMEDVVDLRDTLSDDEQVLDNKAKTLEQIAQIKQQKQELGKRMQKLDEMEQELLMKLAKEQQISSHNNATQSRENEHGTYIPQHMRPDWKMRSVEDMEKTIGKGSHETKKPKHDEWDDR